MSLSLRAQSGSHLTVPQLVLCKESALRQVTFLAFFIELICSESFSNKYMGREVKGKNKTQSIKCPHGDAQRKEIESRIIFLTALSDFP